jgi:sec-independent protein translocase protein TatB
VFDFAWSEIALIGIVALIAIGPKDLPIAIKAVAGLIKKARRMAAEFQTHVDELVKEADLSEVRDQFNQIRRFDFREEISKAVDADGSIRNTLSANPLAEPFKPVTPPPEPTPSIENTGPEETRVLERPPQTIYHPDTPPFIPPGNQAPAEPAEPAPTHSAPPAFIPPELTGGGPKQG